MKYLYAIMDHTLAWILLVGFVTCMFVEFIVTYEDRST